MYKHILVATDGSAFSARAIRTAAGLAKSLGAKLTGLHIVAAYAPASGRLPIYALAGYEPELRKQQKHALDFVKKEAKACGVKAAVASVVGGEPWRAILETAKKRKCDLIVMASHGRSGVSGLLLGSETNKVLAHARLPVLVCRSGGD